MSLSIYLTEACFIFYSVATAYIQATIFKNRIKDNNPESINHPAWALAYAVYVIAIIIVMHSSLAFGIVNALFIREIFFAPALNLWRKKGFFYFNPEGKSYTDPVIGTRKRYIAVYAVSCVLFICLQIIITKT